MTKNIDKCLKSLEALSTERLHQSNCKLRSDLGCTEWRLAISLLATVRKEMPREFGCSSLAEYAEKQLELAPQKANELVSTARVLENLPRFSDAFRAGRLSWTKVRALKRVITPETEETWLNYASRHSSREVERRVVQSPTRWKRSQALNASLEGQPEAQKEEVQQLLVQSVPASKPPAPVATVAVPTEPGPPETPKYIRLTFDLTCDQYAVYQATAGRVWAKKGRKVSRTEVLMELCHQELDQGSARSRARHQVIVHTNETGQAWYETDRGVLPANSEVLKEALKARPPFLAADLKRTYARGLTADTNTGPSYARNEREAVPTGVIRAVYARADNRCEKCDSRAWQLYLHHKKRVCDGGTNELENLELLCGGCHDLNHEPDFETRPEWKRARARRKSGQ